VTETPEKTDYDLVRKRILESDPKVISPHTRIALDALNRMMNAATIDLGFTAQDVALLGRDPRLVHPDAYEGYRRIAAKIEALLHP
jgi:hypothetical protein